MNVPEEALAPAVNTFRRTMYEHNILTSLAPTHHSMKAALEAAAPVIQAAAVQDYIERKEIPKFKIEFTNQPMFDRVIREAKAQAIREAAEVWGKDTWQDVWAGDDVDDDVTAVQSTVRWLQARADALEANE
jgi:hypothetical protein